MKFKLTGDPATGKLHLTQADTVIEIDAEEVPALVGQVLAATICVKAGQEYPPKMDGSPIKFN